MGFLFSYLEISAQDIDLNQPLNEETFQKWDKYIKENAPSQQALNVVINMVNRHYWAGRAAVSLHIWDMYKDLFPSVAKDIKEEMSRLEEVMLTQTPQEDMLYLYVDYIEKNADSENGCVALQRLTDKYINLHMWDSATAYYRYFKPKFPSMQKKFDKIIEILNAPVQGITIRNLSDSINSTLDEWDPTPSADGKRIYFSSRYKQPCYGNSDVYYSDLDSLGHWGKAKNIGKEINGSQDETVDNISVDGNTLLLSGTFPGTFGNFDIYHAEKTAEGWSSVKHFPYPINSEYTDEGANISSDGKYLVFTSDRPGGIGEYHPYGTVFHGNVMGNMDIYVCQKTDSGWSAPINLGTIVNTPYSERAPYLHPDGKTLYFSSDGHPGLGRMDLFVTTRLSDTSWTEWSEPRNLGKEINTANDDWGYAVSLNGDSAYFAAYDRPDGKGGWDLFTITVPDSAKPNKVVTVRGKVTDNKNNILPAVIRWENLETGEKIGEVRTNPQTGDYFIVLPLGKNYGYYAEYSDYYPTSGNVDLRKIKSNKDIRKDLILVSSKAIKEDNAKLQVNNIFFDFDKYDLKPESFPELDRLIAFLKKNMEKSIIIEGHTDNAGTEAFNMELSRKRAATVKNYLVEHGISKNKIKTIGFGATKPINDNSTPEKQAENRRVEISFEK